MRSSLYTPTVTSLYDPPLTDLSIAEDTGRHGVNDSDITEGGGGASECKELTPIEHLENIETLLSLSTEEWRSKSTTTSAVEKPRALFEQINHENYDENILFRSRRLKVVEAMSPGSEQPEAKGIVEIAQLARADTEKNDEEEEVEVEEEEEKTQEESKGIKIRTEALKMKDKDQRADQSDKEDQPNGHQDQQTK